MQRRPQEIRLWRLVRDCTGGNGCVTKGARSGNRLLTKGCADPPAPPAAKELKARPLCCNAAIPSYRGFANSLGYPSGSRSAAEWTQKCVDRRPGTSGRATSGARPTSSRVKRRNCRHSRPANCAKHPRLSPRHPSHPSSSLAYCLSPQSASTAYSVGLVSPQWQLRTVDPGPRPSGAAPCLTHSSYLLEGRQSARA